ncbi:MAG: hypothetical protein ACI9Q9_001021, partial [Flavobacterium sp.]
KKRWELMMVSITNLGLSKSLYGTTQIRLVYQFK